MFCRKCGAELRLNARFCAKCGARAPEPDQMPKWDTSTRNTNTSHSSTQSTAAQNSASKGDRTQSSGTQSKSEKNMTMSVEELLQLAARYGEVEDYRQQLHILEQAKIQDPNVSGIYNLMGIAHRNLGEYNEALECYKRASELDPENGTFLTNTGIVMLSSGHAEEALVWFEKGLPMLKKANSPVYPSALGNYALALAEAGYTDNAVRRLKEATQLGYTNAGLVRERMEELGIFYH